MAATVIATRGRGAQSNASGRFESRTHETFDDGWTDADAAPEPLRTTVTAESARRIITRNDSPDVGFDRSINPYRGCEHGCIYCYARPSHAYMGLSPGLDFETKLFAKPSAPTLLRKAFAARGLYTATAGAGHKHRSLSADRGALSDNPGSAGALP